MISYFRRIRRTLMEEKQVGKYLKYAVGEILLVVIGILIALQINNWNNQRLERIEERKTYENIRQQVLDDKAELGKVIQYNDYHTGNYEYANNMILSGRRQSTDTLALIVMSLSLYSDFHRSGKVYETLVNSGDIKLIQNQDLISKLQQLEMTYTFINKLETMNWDMIINDLSPELRGVINFATRKPVQPDRLYAVEIQNLLVTTIELNRYKAAIYSKALEEIEAIVSVIDSELEGK